MDIDQTANERTWLPTVVCGVLEDVKRKGAGALIGLAFSGDGQWLSGREDGSRRRDVTCRVASLQAALQLCSSSSNKNGVARQGLPTATNGLVGLVAGGEGERLQGCLAKDRLEHSGDQYPICLEHRAQLRLVNALLGIACRLLHGRFCCFFDL